MIETSRGRVEHRQDHPSLELSAESIRNPLSEILESRRTGHQRRIQPHFSNLPPTVVFRQQRAIELSLGPTFDTLHQFSTVCSRKMCPYYQTLPETLQDISGTLIVSLLFRVA